MDFAEYAETRSTPAGMAGKQDRAMTRYKYDTGKMVENNEISTGPGRYRLGVPNAYGNAVFVPDVTTRMQKWGAAHDMSSTKTDVESDLRNLARPPTRAVCGQYDPTREAPRTLTAMPEAEFPQTFARLVDPPCTLRGTGWNRWEWLCQNPQENVMMPFEWNTDSRHAVKDGYSPDAAMKYQCGVFSEAVPVPRHPGLKDAPNFTDRIPGASYKPMGTPPAARGVARGAAQTGSKFPDAPPITPYHEQERATTGRLAPPPPFSSMIAPH
jgi:hypothetical protein